MMGLMLLGEETPESLLPLASEGTVKRQKELSQNPTSSLQNGEEINFSLIKLL